jgi:hypothetical protein
MLDWFRCSPTNVSHAPFFRLHVFQWGLVTYREVDLLIDPVRASSQQKQRVATVVTHELAHQVSGWIAIGIGMNIWIGSLFPVPTNEVFVVGSLYFSLSFSRLL